MILRRLRLRHFLGFEDRTFDFVPGINVVVGPNESGKSSLRTAIRAALFGNPNTTSAGVDIYRTWGTDQLPALDLDFLFDGRPYRLSKDFQGRKPVLIGGGETLDQHKHIAERIAGFLGLSTAKVFLTTAEVAQAELERVQLTSVSNELSRVLGGGPDVEDGIKRLTAHVSDMEKGQERSVRDPGELWKCEDRVKALNAQRESVVAEITQIERKQEELSQLQPSVAELESSLAAKQKLLDTNLKTLDMTRDLERLRREETDLSGRVGRIDQTREQLVQIGRELEAVTASGIPDEALLRRAQLAEARIAHLTDTIASMSASPTPQPATPPQRWGPWIAGGALIIVIGALVGWLIAPLPGAALGAIGVALAAVGATIWNRHRLILVARTMSSVEQESRVRALQQELDSARQQLAEQKAALGGQTLDEVNGRLQKYLDLVRQREELVRLAETLSAGTTEDALRDRLGRLRTDIYGLTRELDSLDRAAVSLPAFETQKLRDEVEDLTKKLAEKAERAKRLAWEIEHRRNQTEDLAALEEELHEATEVFEGAVHRHQVYKTALEAMREAKGHVERPVRDVVAGKASDYLQILSGGRYNRIEVEKSLQVWVWSADAGERVEPREPYLSRGTIDLVYLSLRFALVTSLAEGRHPPLLLDDPFITFDDSRRAAAAELLKELSQTHQVFLFTCGEWFNADAGNVILLPGRVPTGEAPAPDTGVDRQPAEIPAVGPLWERGPN